MLSPPVPRIIHVVKDHRGLLEQPGSPTGKLVAIWTEVMVLPWFILLPLTLLFDGKELAARLAGRGYTG